MLKVSKLNPKDTTLDEIHAIQQAHYNQQKGWTFEQLQSHYNRVIEKISKELGCKTKTVKPDDFALKFSRPTS